MTYIYLVVQPSLDYDECEYVDSYWSTPEAAKERAKQLPKKTYPDVERVELDNPEAEKELVQ